MTALQNLEGTFSADPAHSRIGFSVRHMMVSKVRGEFNDYSVTANFAQNAKPQVEVTIEAESVDTGNADRDTHLKQEDFFGSEQFPQIRFVTTDVTPVDEDTVKVSGELTIRETTKPVTLDMEVGGVLVDPYGLQRVGLEGKTSIKRSEYGVSFNAAMETGGVVVSDKVDLEIELALVKPAN
ncbi:YceI family protein [Micrococcoides hystricis]|uniref:YceI family protein n=1 Tax=Micrococcoides hystricis TaxID=1572761 RepID=A0ABV6P897_9MICC